MRSFYMMIFFLGTLHLGKVFAADEGLQSHEENKELINPSTHPGSVGIYLRPTPRQSLFTIYLRNTYFARYSDHSTQPDVQGDIRYPIRVLGEGLATILGFNCLRSLLILDSIESSQAPLACLPHPEMATRMLAMTSRSRRLTTVPGLITELELLHFLAQGSLPLALPSFESPRGHHAMVHDLLNHFPLQVILPQPWLTYIQERMRLFMQLRTMTLERAPQYETIFDECLTYHVVGSYDSHHGTLNDSLGARRSWSMGSSHFFSEQVRRLVLGTTRILPQRSDDRSAIFQLRENFGEFIKEFSVSIFCRVTSSDFQTLVQNLAQEVAQGTTVEVSLPVRSERVFEILAEERADLMQEFVHVAHHHGLTPPTDITLPQSGSSMLCLMILYLGWQLGQLFNPTDSH